MNLLPRLKPRSRKPEWIWTRFHSRSALGLILVFAVAALAPGYVIFGQDGAIISGALVPTAFYWITETLFHDLKEAEITGVLEAKIFNEQLKSLSSIFNYAGTALLATLTFSGLALFDNAAGAEHIIERAALGSAGCLWFNRVARQCLGFLKDERPEAYLSDSK